MPATADNMAQKTKVQTLSVSFVPQTLSEIALHDKHRSSEFISLLREMDAYYPAESTIRIILDNHSAHISKETMKYLAGIPGRFVYVHTPKHGSWLNLVETLFGKMARTFLFTRRSFYWSTPL